MEEIKKAFPPAVVKEPPPPGKEEQSLQQEPTRLPAPDPVADPQDAQGYVDGLTPWKPIDGVVAEVARAGDKVLCAHADHLVLVETDVAVVELSSDLGFAAQQLSTALYQSKMVVAFWPSTTATWHSEGDRLGVAYPKALIAMTATFQPRRLKAGKYMVVVMRGLRGDSNMQPDLDSPNSKITWNPKPSAPEELQQVMQDPLKPYTDGPDAWPKDAPPYPPSSPRELAPMSPFMGPLAPSLGSRAALGKWSEKQGAGPGDQQSLITDEGIATRQMENPALGDAPFRPLGPGIPEQLPDEHDSGGGRPRGNRWEQDGPDSPRGDAGYGTPLAGGALCVYCGGVIAGDSFFDHCDRDEKGHCKKGPGGGGEKSKAPSKKKEEEEPAGGGKGSSPGAAVQTKVQRVDTGKKDRAGKPIMEWQTADGKALPAHIPRIPPAWSNVVINEDPKAVMVAKGTDSKGRIIRLYSEKFHGEQAALKFSRIRELRGKQDAIRSEMEQDLKSPDEKVKEAATAALLIQATGIRPGSETDTKAEKQAYGATTLEAQHVVVGEDGGVTLSFTGKKGVALNIPVKDPTVAAMLKEKAAQAGGPEGKLFPNTSDAALRDYVHEKDGGSFKPKDFRTARGTNIAAELVKGLPVPKDEKAYKKQVMEVAKQVSAALGNTPVIALQSYIDPTVFAAWQ